MSRTIQDKMLQYEVLPPEAVWVSIASELDESAATHLLAAKLTNYTVTAPASIWERINTELDYTFESDSVSSKLYAAEVVPPAAAWINIAAGLDAAKEVSITEKRRLSPIIRYAAAAVVTGIIVMAGFRFFGSPDKQNAVASVDGKNTVTEAIGHSAETIAVNKKEENTSLTASDADEARNDAALEESKHTFAKLDINRSKTSAIAAGFSFSSYTEPAETSSTGTTGYEEGNSNTDDKANRYILLMTPEGHVIRVSKKLSNMVCCVSGEEADQQCKSQMEKWRKQLACSDASHPGNFMDILSLVGSLQDNQ